MFGGKYPETRIETYCNAFASAFHKEKNLKRREAVGAVPPMRDCLKSPKVCHEVGDAGPDNMQIAMAEVQYANTIACNLLTVQVFDGNLLL